MSYAPMLPWLAPADWGVKVRLGGCQCHHRDPSKCRAGFGDAKPCPCACHDPRISPEEVGRR